MCSTPILRLICLLVIFLGQMPFMISAKPIDASSPSDNSSQQFEKDLFEAAGLNFTRLDNQTRTIFDKMIEMCNTNNVTMTEEEQKQLTAQFFDVADENKYGQLTSEEMAGFIMYLAVHNINSNINPEKLTEFQRARIVKLLKELSPKMREEAKKGAIDVIENWDMDADGKLSKKEAEESIMPKDAFKMGKFKRAVDMKMAMKNGVTENWVDGLI